MSRYVPDPGGSFVLVAGPVAAWVMEQLAPRLSNGRDLPVEVFEALVDLRRAADSFRAGFRPEEVAGPLAVVGSQSTCGCVEASGLLGMTPRAVRSAAQERRLVGERTPQGWRFTSGAIEEFRAQRRRTA